MIQFFSRPLSRRHECFGSGGGTRASWLHFSGVRSMRPSAPTSLAIIRKGLRPDRSETGASMSPTSFSGMHVPFELRPSRNWSAYAAAISVTRAAQARRCRTQIAIGRTSIWARHGAFSTGMLSIRAFDDLEGAQRSTAIRGGGRALEDSGLTTRRSQPRLRRLAMSREPRAYAVIQRRWRSPMGRLQRGGLHRLAQAPTAAPAGELSSGGTQSERRVRPGDCSADHPLRIELSAR